jgi:DNA-binding NarL/FixJ family response regulator
VSIRVLIADDEAMVRAGLKLILERHDDMVVVAEARDGLEAVQFAQRCHPDVVLMDVRMPRLDGIEATRRLINDASAGTVRVVVLTTFDLDEYVFRALRAGASGFMLKEASPEQLVAAIRLVATGDALLAPARTRQLIMEHVRPAGGSSANVLSSLTARESEVLKLIARGLSNAQIAAALQVGETTVRTHVAHILSKLGVSTRVQAVVIAYESELVQPART